MNKKNIIAIVILILVLGLLGLGFLQIKNLRSRIAEAEWTIVYQVELKEDTITPDVGTIQFLKRGFSIELESIKYTADGLYLKGFIGNPLILWVSTLTIKFTVTKPLYEYKDEFAAKPYFFFIGLQPIGEAQTSPIASLAPKTKVPFEVTIPNVKQTKEGIRIAVAFTGERYAYGE
jgi:hypothetical protein